MRRVDIFLVVIVGAFAVFVGWGIATRPAAPRIRALARAEQAETGTTENATQPPSGLATPPQAHVPRAAADLRDVNVLTRGAIARVANVEQVRQQIASATGGYMADMLAADSGLLVRWPDDRREKGLRVWVQSISTVRDWDTRYAQMARDAFADWSADLPARLDFVFDSASSDIRVVWLDRFPPEMGRRVGNTNRANDQNGWIVSADVSVAVHDSIGQRIEPANLAGIVRHEAGHALGLGHSKDSTTKMFPVEMTSTITPADRATLRLLYQLSPGSVR
ncbi:MAG: matrixin family metalloprotease [Deltaproteobacteria bacterium]